MTGNKSERLMHLIGWFIWIYNIIFHKQFAFKMLCCMLYTQWWWKKF